MEIYIKLIHFHINNGTNALVPAGTTGESPNLTIKDREIIYSTAIDSVGNKANIIAGTGTYSTSETVEITKMADSIGVDGIMIVTPYYSKPSQLGILKHFEETQSPRSKIIYDDFDKYEQLFWLVSPAALNVKDLLKATTANAA